MDDPVVCRETLLAVRGQPVFIVTGHVGARTRVPAAEPSPEQDVIPWLRQLGFRPDEARRAAARCEAIPDAPLEQRVRLALSCFAKPPHGRSASTMAS